MIVISQLRSVEQDSGSATTSTSVLDVVDSVKRSY